MDNLPVPKTRVGLFCGLLLTIISLIIYYLFLYQGLEASYFGHYWTRGPYSQTTAVKIDIYAPRFLYSLVEREFRLQVKNLDQSKPVSVDIIVSLSEPDQTGKINQSINEYMVLICTEETDDTKGCNTGSSTVSFGEILPNSTSTRTVWVSVKPIAKTAPLFLEFFKNPENLYFEYYLLLDEDLIDDQEGVYKKLSLSDAGSSRLDIGLTLTQSFIGIILLPPWANGLIPALAFLVTWYFEGALISTYNSSYPSGKPVKKEQKIFGWRARIKEYLSILSQAFSDGLKILQNQCVWAWFASFFGILLFLVYLPQLILDWRDEPLQNWESHLMGLSVSVLLLLVSLLWTRRNTCILERNNSLEHTENDFDDIQYLLGKHPEFFTLLPGIQTRHTQLNNMEKYFSILDEDTWENEPVQIALIESVNATPSWLLVQCSERVLIRELVKLSLSSKAPKTSDRVDLLEGLVCVGTDLIDEVLVEELKQNDKVKILCILGALEKSNRSVEDLLIFFEPLKSTLDQEIIKKIASALQKNARQLPKYHRDVRALLSGAEKSLKINGPLLNKITDLRFRKNLLEIGAQICSVDFETARWFIYDELSKLSDDDPFLKEEFFQFMQRLIPKLERNLREKKYPNKSDNFWSVLDHNWDHPDPENIGDLPNEIKAPYRAAFKKKPDDALSQESDDNRDEKSNEQQNRNQDETQDSNPNQDTPPSE